MQLLSPLQGCCDDQMTLHAKGSVPCLVHSKCLTNATSVVEVIIVVFKFAAQKRKSSDVLTVLGEPGGHASILGS